MFFEDLYIYNLIDDLHVIFEGIDDDEAASAIKTAVLNCELVDEDLRMALYADKYISSLIKKYIMSLFPTIWERHDLHELLSELPLLLQDSKRLFEVLEELISERFITTDEYVYWRFTESAFEFIPRYYNDEAKAILDAISRGILYDESNDNGFIVDCVLNDWHFSEDKFSYFYINSLISRNDFISIFDINERTYDYLSYRYSYEKKYNQDASTVKRLSKAAKNQEVVINGESVKFNKESLIDITLRRFCRNTTDFSVFMERYQYVLHECGLEHDPRFSIPAGTFVNKLAERKNVLAKQWQRIRYYNIDEYDFDELYNTLDLKQYHDVELSTLKLMKEYPTLMKSYDIEDEYELHNLLKKTASFYDIGQVKFNRMPTLSFGSSDRDKQIEDLLFAHAPISTNDFANLVEAEFGFKAATVLGSMINHIKKYEYNGLLKIDFPKLSSVHYEKLKAALKLDFYTLDSVKSIFIKIFNDNDLSGINSYTLKLLGFHVYSNYIIKNTYRNAQEYFEYLLSGDVINLAGIDADIKRITLFSGTLYDYIHQYKLYEIKKDIYVSNKVLLENKLNTEIIKEFIGRVKSLVANSPYMSTKKIRFAELNHPVVDSGLFDDWGLSSLIAFHIDNIGTLRFANTRIFNINCREFHISDYIFYFMKSKSMTSISIDRLLQQVKGDDGVNLVKSKVVSALTNCDQFLYDAASGIVHLISKTESNDNDSFKAALDLLLI